MLLRVCVVLCICESVLGLCFFVFVLRFSCVCVLVSLPVCSSVWIFLCVSVGLFRMCCVYLCVCVCLFVCLCFVCGNEFVKVCV